MANHLHPLLLSLIATLATQSPDWQQAVWGDSQVRVPVASLSSDGPKQDVFNIVDCGAVGDGQTDCTIVIQRVIDAAAVRGGVVLVPVGRFLVTGNLVLKMGVHLTGRNEAPTPVKVVRKLFCIPDL